MSNITLGILNIDILKAKNLYKIDNGTKKNLTIKNPIIKIEYISGTKITCPAKGQDDSFDWNYKLNFELIRDKTSFFLQCYNNATEDNFNLLGETRIPLILVIENGKFKQWYPIYLKEKKNKFVCRGEILLDMVFYSNEKIKNENLDYYSLLCNESLDSQINTSDIYNSEINPPATMPRTIRNLGYASNSISRYPTIESKTNELHENLLYDDNLFEENYNNYYKNKQDNTNIISRSYSFNTSKNFRKKKLNHFNSLPSFKNFEINHLINYNGNNENNYYNINNGNNKSLLSRKISKRNEMKNYEKNSNTKKFNISPSSSISPILESSPNLNKINISKDINRGFSTSISERPVLPLSDYHKYDIINSSINRNKSFPGSFEYNKINNPMLYNFYNNQSNSYELEFIPKNDAASDSQSFQNMKNMNINTQQNIELLINEFESNQNYNIKINKSDIINQNSIGIDNSSNIVKKSSSSLKNNILDHSIALNELTLDEQEFVKKLNKKYNKNIILIDNENNNIINNICLTSTTEEDSFIQSNENQNHILDNKNIKSKKSSSKSLFKTIFSSKSKKKKKNRKYKDDRLSVKMNKHTPLKKIKNIITFNNSKTSIKNNTLDPLDENEINFENYSLVYNEINTSEQKNYNKPIEVNDKENIKPSTNQLIKNNTNKKIQETKIKNSLIKSNKIKYNNYETNSIDQNYYSSGEFNMMESENKENIIIKNLTNENSIKKSINSKGKTPEMNEARDNYNSNERKKLNNYNNLNISYHINDDDNEGDDDDNYLDLIYNDYNNSSSTISCSKEDFNPSRNKNLNTNSSLNESSYPLINSNIERQYRSLPRSYKINQPKENNQLSTQITNDKGKDNERMIQKLQFQQLTERLNLTLNHYKEYQDLVKQINDNEQNFNKFSKMKKQLYKQQQTQLQIQNDLHSQQLLDLKNYLSSNSVN